jgi:hypothetical protein
MIYYFDTCRDSIRTIPMLQHDETRVEDVDSDMEDHAADSARYACMSRPYVRPKPEEPPKPRFLNEISFNELVESTPKQHGVRI